ncbi:MAG: amidohydrolase family protein [Tissierellia bacterium]|nr:amidohydrolase family protein [Tissierellia bacterium]
MKNNKEGEEKEIIDKVLNKEVPLFITAKTKAEINALINIVKDYDINLVLCNAYQAEKCIESIKEVNASVIMGEQIYLSKNVYNNIDLSKLVEMKTGNNAIGFTVTGDYGPSGKVKYLWNVARLYQSGIDSEEVVKMMTYYPAKMLGIDNIIGTIEAGKDADITIYSNNPIKYYDARNKYTIIQGKIVYKEGGCEKCC